MDNQAYSTSCMQSDIVWDIFQFAEQKWMQLQKRFIVKWAELPVRISTELFDQKTMENIEEQTDMTHCVIETTDPTCRQRLWPYGAV